MDNISNKVTSGLFWNYGERILAQLVSLVVSVVLARLIEPEHFGAISIVTVMITLCNVFISNGFGNALIQAKEAEKPVFNSMFYISFVLSLVLYAAVFVSAPFIAKFYKMDILNPVIRVMGLRLPIASLNTVQHAYLVRKLEFKKFFITTLPGTVASAVVGIAMAYFGFGIWALVAQYLTNVTIDTILLYIICGWRPGLKADWQGGKKLLPFGAKILGAALLLNIYDEISDLVVGKKFEVSNLAYYSKGKQFPSIIVTNINSSISRVLFSAMSKYQDDLIRIKSMLRRSLKINAYIIGPVMIGMFVCADDIIRIVLSDKWADSTVYLQIFCIMFFLKSIRNTYTQGFNSIGKSGIMLGVQIVSTALGLVLLFVSAFIIKNVLAVAYSTCIVQLVAVIICIASSKKSFNYLFKEFLVDIIPILLINVMMAGVVFLIGFIPIKIKIIELGIKVIAGCLSYWGFSKLFKIDSYSYVLAMAKPYIKRFKKH